MCIWRVQYTSPTSTVYLVHEPRVKFTSSTSHEYCLPRPRATNNVYLVHKPKPSEGRGQTQDTQQCPGWRKGGVTVVARLFTHLHVRWYQVLSQALGDAGHLPKTYSVVCYLMRQFSQYVAILSHIYSRFISYERKGDFLT